MPVIDLKKQEREVELNISSPIKDDLTKRRCYIAELVKRGLEKFFETENISIDNSNSIYRLPVINEELNVIDFEINSLSVHVIATVDKAKNTNVYIPAVYKTYNYKPDIMIFINFTKGLTKMDIVGYLTTLNTNNSAIDKSSLNSANDLIMALKTTQKAPQIFTTKTEETTQELMLAYLEKDLSDEGVRFFLKHLISSPKIRHNFKLFYALNCDFVSISQADFIEKVAPTAKASLTYFYKEEDAAIEKMVEHTEPSINDSENIEDSEFVTAPNTYEEVQQNIVEEYEEEIEENYEEEQSQDEYEEVEATAEEIEMFSEDSFEEVDEIQTIEEVAEVENTQEELELYENEELLEETQENIVEEELLEQTSDGELLIQEDLSEALSLSEEEQSLLSNDENINEEPLIFDTAGTEEENLILDSEEELLLESDDEEEMPLHEEEPQFLEEAPLEEIQQAEENTIIEQEEQSEDENFEAPMDDEDAELFEIAEEATFDSAEYDIQSPTHRGADVLSSLEYDDEQETLTTRDVMDNHSTAISNDATDLFAFLADVPSATTSVTEEKSTGNTTESFNQSIKVSQQEIYEAENQNYNSTQANIVSSSFGSEAQYEQNTRQNPFETTQTPKEKRNSTPLLAALLVLALGTLGVYNFKDQIMTKIAEFQNPTATGENLLLPPAQLPSNTLTPDEKAVPVAELPAAVGTTAEPKQKQPTTAGTTAEKVTPEDDAPALPSLPKATTVEPPKPRNLNDAIANAISKDFNGVRISRVSWEISETLASNPEVSRALTMAGRSVKSFLAQDLMAATEPSFNDKVVINLVYRKDGSVEKIELDSSSGSKQIDDIIIKTVKDTMNRIHMPSLNLNKDKYSTKLVINL